MQFLRETTQRTAFRHTRSCIVPHQVVRRYSSNPLIFASRRAIYAKRQLQKHDSPLWLVGLLHMQHKRHYSVASDQSTDATHGVVDSNSVIPTSPVEVLPSVPVSSDADSIQVVVETVGSSLWDYCPDGDTFAQAAHGIENILGIPMWATIALTGFFVRLCTVPYVAQAIRLQYEMRMPEFIRQKQLAAGKIQRARSEGNDALVSKLAAEQMQDSGLSWNKMKPSILMGLPIFPFLLGISHMVQNDPTFVSSGLIYCPNLTVSDPVTTACFASLLFLGNEVQGLQGAQLAVLRLAPLAIFYFGCTYFSSASTIFLTGAHVPYVAIQLLLRYHQPTRDFFQVPNPFAPELINKATVVTKNKDNSSFGPPVAPERPETFKNKPKRTKNK